MSKVLVCFYHRSSSFDECKFLALFQIYMFTEFNMQKQFSNFNDYMVECLINCFVILIVRKVKQAILIIADFKVFQHPQ